MKKPKDPIQFPVGSNVRVKALNLYGIVKGFYVGRTYVEYCILVNFNHKKQKMFFKDDELDLV